MIDFIFKNWQKKLSDFESSVKKDLAEIRKCKAEIQKCKAEIQQMRQDTEFERQKGRYIRDDERLILSAPEIIIGNVDETGVHFDSAGSTVIVRGSHVGLQGIGQGGQVEMRSESIRQIAEDPGCDGLEHVVGSRSEVVSQARHIVLHSQADEGVFSEVIQKAERVCASMLMRRLRSTPLCRLSITKNGSPNSLRSSRSIRKSLRRSQHCIKSLSGRWWR